MLKHKLRSNGSLKHYKAWWVILGFNQCLGVDFGETFTLSIEQTTIRTILTIVISKQSQPINLMDPTPFSTATWRSRVYCQQPTGFTNPFHPDVFRLLSLSLYGLRQAPRAWFTQFAKFVTSIGFKQTLSIDMELSTSSNELMLITKLQTTFPVKDMGTL